jgi:hypothetical protein
MAYIRRKAAIAAMIAVSQDLKLTGMTDEAIAAMIAISQDLKQQMKQLRRIHGEEGPETWQDDLASYMEMLHYNLFTRLTYGQD